MTKIFRVFFLLLFIAFGSLLKAQKGPKEFDRDPEKFIKELSEFMDASRQKEGRKFVEDDFSPVFLSTTYSLEQQKLIQDFCDVMLQKNVRAYPGFENYLLALIAFPQSNKAAADFAAWHVLLNQMTQKKYLKYIPEFNGNVASLFQSGTFYVSKSLNWRSSSDVYQFEFDSLPKIVFPELNLICTAKGDSSVIYETGGVFFPTLERWYGNGGKVSWERAAFDPAKTFAEFDRYDIKLISSNFSIDSVRFYNEFFDKPLLGQLTEKILANKTGDDASYPRFESYNKRLQIPHIFNQVDFEGGFTMAGNKLQGSGTFEEPAIITISRDSRAFLTARSLAFSIRPDRITSSNASVLIRIENDSIFHPDLQFKFNNDSRQLILLRSEEGVSKSPYTNSYHDIDMYFEALYWNIDDPLIKLGNIEGGSQHYAAFESKDYYKKQRYDAMMGLGFLHPLVEIRDFTRQWGSESFYASELASYMRTSVEQVNPLLIDLNNKGFVSYDINTQWCSVNQKLHDYLASNAGKRDYDVIQFSSETSSGQNAQLNLLNNTLLLKGVQHINLSDSQKVTIFPRNGEVLLKKNRDFTVGGRVRAGNFEFLGSQYAFNYDAFQLDLISVDSCRIYVEDASMSADMQGNKAMTRVKNVLEEIGGNIRIDAPTNKSGVHSDVYPEYPILTCEKNSYVYYDNEMIEGGVYGRDAFYYQVEPFQIDSLDNFTKEQLHFDGTLVSAGIFPDITESLVLMEDYSLGFEKQTSSTGLPVYAGKGNFVSDIKLDFKGLQGNGSLEYLTSLAHSEDFHFYPDSTKGRTTSYVNHEQPGAIEIPMVKAAVVDLGFYPKNDLLSATSVVEELEFFNNEAQLKGSLYLQPKGMTGKGDMHFDGATLGSNVFAYKRRKILADSSDFQLAQVDMQNLAFQTKNVSADVDFDLRVGEFKSNGGETKIDFPANQYICFMDEFKWFMDQGEMALSSGRKATDDFVIDTSENQANSNFFSVHAEQDSLNFLAPNAIYDISASVITCKDIKYISVADSKVTPDSGKVVIQKRANMDELIGASVLSNYVTQYHNIFNATVKVEGRKDYYGSGDYIYKDELGSDQVIHIDAFEVDTTLQTVGRGFIDESDAFSLSPFFQFYGGFELSANQENLTFEGGTRIIHNCDLMERNWFKFRAEIDPKDIYIPVDTNLRDMGMSKLGVGVMVTDNAPFKLYPAFLSAKRDRQDEALIDALGYLYYNKKSGQYQVGGKDKLKQPKLPGNLISLDQDNCEIVGEGRINYGVKYGALAFESVGEVRHNSAKSETQISGVSGVNFFFDETLLKYLSDKFLAWPGLRPIDLSNTKYEQAIIELLGTERSDKIISDLNLSGTMKKIPQEMQHSFYFADLKFEWNEVDEAYQSIGTLGLASMDKKQMFLYLKGKVEVEKRRSGDVLRMYMELDKNHWYYFEYKLGIMNISSSDKEFMTMLQEVKDDKRKFKDEAGERFTYQGIASVKRRDDFVARFPELD